MKQTIYVWLVPMMCSYDIKRVKNQDTNEQTGFKALRWQSTK